MTLECISIATMGGQRQDDCAVKLDTVQVYLMGKAMQCEGEPYGTDPANTRQHMTRQGNDNIGAMRT